MLDDSILLPETRTGFVYALTDPRIDDPFLAVRYIGITRFSITGRLANHIGEARCGREANRLRWIRSLLADGVTPNIVILESVPIDQLPEREIACIASYREQGARLTNATGGGDGAHLLSEEVREKLRRARLGKTMSAAGREKMRQVGRLRARTAEWRANMCQAGRRASPETREKMRISHLGVKHTPEAREKISASNSRRPGKKASLATRARMVISQQARWVRRKAATSALQTSFLALC